MKKTYLCFLAAVSLAIVSCGDDDSNDNGLITVNPDPTEEIALDPSNVSENIIIANGTKVEGDAPAPNGDLSFSLTETNQSAFQKSGFEITFNAPANYAGSYIQVVSSNGTKASSYWDVSGFGKTKSSQQKSKRNKKRAITTTAKQLEDEVEIDVDFENTITAGTFCYFICIYDTDGNISEPVEVCVEVEAWGGNPNVTGTWNYIKTVTNGETIELGQENFCEGDITITCDNQNTILIDEAWCYVTTSLIMNFNEDGTYSYTEKYFNSKALNYDTTQANCEATFDSDEEESIYVSKGNWAYDEEEGNLTLVEFEWTDDGVSESSEDGNLVFNGKAEITGTSLIIKEEDTEDDFNYSSEFYFNR